MSNSKKDCVSFSINFTLPPKAIKTYFDGLAKVEKAKSSSNKLSCDLLSIAAIALPLVMPAVMGFLSQSSDNQSESKKCPMKGEEVCPMKGKGKCPMKSKDSKCPLGFSQKNLSDIGRGQIVAQVIAEFPSTLRENKDVNEIIDEICDKVTEKGSCSYEDVSKIITEMVDKVTAVKVLSPEDEKCEEDDKKAEEILDAVDKELECVTKKEECEESKSKPKPKAIYKDGDNFVFDLKEMTNMFGGGANGGAQNPLGDIMKMFEPMMSGMMGGMVNQKPVEPIPKQCPKEESCDVKPEECPREECCDEKSEECCNEKAEECCNEKSEKLEKSC